jgi:WD40 repeat protein
MGKTAAGKKTEMDFIISPFPRFRGHPRLACFCSDLRPNGGLVCLLCGRFSPLCRARFVPPFGAKPNPTHTMTPTTPTEPGSYRAPELAQPMSGRMPDNHQYKIGDMIARGGMGVVFEARHRELGRSVALKIVRGACVADSNEMGRFRAETEAAARLDHPNIVPIYDVGEMYGQPYFTMKLIEGGSLADQLKKGPLPPRDAARIMAKVARAVHHAHERGVLHRDLKPGNILIDKSGEPFITDFGLAKFAETDLSLTIPGEVIGTPEYMSPEQTRGDDLTMGSDVWAMGVVLYQMLSGEMPFKGANAMEIFDRIGNAEAPQLFTVHSSGGVTTTVSAKGGIDRDISTIVARCLEKDPSRRMPSAGFLAEELERWLAGEPIRSRRVTQAERVVKWMRRHPGAVAAAALVMLSITVGSVASLVLWRRAEGVNLTLNSTNDQLYDANTKLASTNAAVEKSNAELAISLRRSKATQLAGDARMVVRENAPLGLSLAVQSTEIMRKAGDQPLPETVGSLMYALTKVGGLDFSALPGHETGEDGYFNWTYMMLMEAESQNCPVESPDGRWLVTSEFALDGIHFSVFKQGLPLSNVPVRRFVYPKAKPDSSRFLQRWTADSRLLITVDNSSKEVRAWRLLEGLDDEGNAPGELPEPRYTVLSKCQGTTGGAVALKKEDGSIHGLIQLSESAGGNVSDPSWLPLDGVREDTLDNISLPEPLTIQENVEKRGRKAVGTNSRSGKWMLNYDNFKGGSSLVLFKTERIGEAPLPITLRQKNELITSATFSPDDRWLSYSDKNHVYLHDLTLAPSDPAFFNGVRVGEGSEVEFSPDGKWLAITRTLNAVEFIPVGSDGPRFEHAFRARVDAGQVKQMVFSPDSQWIALACRDTVIRVISIAKAKDGEPPIELYGLSNEAIRVQFSRDGRIITAAARDGEVRRWEFSGMNSGAQPHIHPPTPTVAETLAVSPDGRWIASTGGYSKEGESAVYITDIRTGRVLEITRHERPRAATFSPCGRWFATSGLDAIVRWWDWPALMAALESGSPLPEASELKTNLDTHPESHHIAIHPAGRIYAAFTGGIFLNIDILSQPTTATEAYYHSINYFYSGLAISPDGRWMALGRHGNDFEPRSDTTQFGNLVLIFDLADPCKPVLKTELRNSYSHLGQVRFSPDSRWLAATGTGNPFRIWDMTAPDIAASALDAPITSKTGCIAFPPKDSPLGTRLAAMDSAGIIHLWDWTKGAADNRRIESGVRGRAAVFLPDGRLVTSHDDNRLRIWQLEPDKLVEMANSLGARPLTREERRRFLSE